jgi:hypothetical protein
MFNVSGVYINVHFSVLRTAADIDKGQEARAKDFLPPASLE